MPLKYTFKEEIVVAYVVIIANKIINANNMLKAGEIDIEISAKGMSEYAMLGLNIKHIIPRAIKMLNINATSKLTTFCCLLDKLLPNFITTKDAKNMF